MPKYTLYLKNKCRLRAFVEVEASSEKEAKKYYYDYIETKEIPKENVIESNYDGWTIEEIEKD